MQTCKLSSPPPTHTHPHLHTHIHTHNRLWPAPGFCARRSLPQTLADAQKRGWLVLGAAAEPGAASAASFVLQQPAVLVMGNEGYGLRNSVRRLCDSMLQASS